MGRANDAVAGGNPCQGRFGLFGGRPAPQQKDDAGAVALNVAILVIVIASSVIPISLGVPPRPLVHRPNDLVRELLPSPFLVAVSLPPPDRQNVVDHQDALLGPALQVPVGGHFVKPRNFRVLQEFLVNVLEGRRDRNALADREAEAVGLVGSVVGILADNDELGLGEGAEIEGGKGILDRGIDGFLGSFPSDKGCEPSKGGRGKVAGEGDLPRRFGVERRRRGHRRR
mmetsp:Transcript_22618/g.62945  ORF Transcript_22618/g.62945 Transcript_22618/m.62945 type:complete len:228 (+) Transcript_22618:726-1409(+)